MKKAVIFDLDDTLAPEEEYVKSGYRCVAGHIEGKFLRGITAEKLYEELYSLYETDHKNVFNRLLEAHSVFYTKENIRELVDVYRTHRPVLSFYEDVRPVLTALRERKIGTGIISDGYAMTQTQKLEVLGAKQLFDKIILTDELGREYWKPAYPVYEMMRLFFQIDFSEMIYVGDNPQKDFYIGKEYPILTVRIDRGDGVYAHCDYKDGIREKVRIRSLMELLPLTER
ncbi:MAG TPA: HAD hydrolase-like protein [Lachnospiraceae bacterium]|nr:HAD hydrolase-like protein [Lachnospiraceae bacterium]